MTPENPYLNEFLNSLEDSFPTSQGEGQNIQPGKNVSPVEKNLSEGEVQGDQESFELLDTLFAEEGFEAGFAERVMGRIEDEKEEASVHQLMPRMFRWIAVAGVAAAVVLLAMVFLEGDGLSIDAMTGLSEVTLADELTLEMY